MRISRTKQRWAEGKPVLATVAHFHDPQSAELIGLLGIDCLWIDLEHQPLGINQLENMVRAARVSNMDVMARPGNGEFSRMARLLEAGASVIMYPRCESADEARALVRAAKFPPLGQRGLFTASPDNPYCMTPLKDYLRLANDETVLLAQVESPHAVTQARAMADVEGIDMLFFGPGDFSLMANVPGEFDSEVVRQGMAETARQALAAGKRFGTLITNLDQAQRALDLGATMLTYGGDMHFVRQAVVEMKHAFGPLGFVFGTTTRDPPQDAAV
ncbi:MAG: aldolase/citrate lyase family protein [Planctomycetota bacterium]|nr:aldolase/citrate lyase family protein [Planctomycetota bacterium]